MVPMPMLDVTFFLDVAVFRDVRSVSPSTADAFGRPVCKSSGVIDG